MALRCGHGLRPAARRIGRDDVALEPVPLDLPDAAGPLAGTVQLWPHRHGTDAMFLTLLRRL